MAAGDELLQARRDTVDDMAGAVAQLRAALDAERGALDAGDSFALDTATAEKARLMQRLESLDAERRQFEQTLGAADARWPGVLAALGECRRLNEINGGIVERRLQDVRRALAVLQGAGEAPPTLYGPGGRTRTQAQRGSLSRA